MKSISDQQQDLIQYYQGGMLISFNHVQKSSTGMDNEVHNFFECDQVKVQTVPDVEEIVAAITTEGFSREYAKCIADEVIMAILE